MAARSGRHAAHPLELVRRQQQARLAARDALDATDAQQHLVELLERVSYPTPPNSVIWRCHPGRNEALFPFCIRPALATTLRAAGVPLISDRSARDLIA